MTYNDILKQDIFFLVTTVAVLVLTVFLTVLIIRMIRISKKLDYIAGKAKEQTDLLSGELEGLRKFLGYFTSWFISRKKKK